MKLRFKFWELDSVGYSNKDRRIHPYVYPPYEKIPGIGFINATPLQLKTLWRTGIRPYKLKKL